MRKILLQREMKIKIINYKKMPSIYVFEVSRHFLFYFLGGKYEYGSGFLALEGIVYRPNSIIAW